MKTYLWVCNELLPKKILKPKYTITMHMLADSLKEAESEIVCHKSCSSLIHT